MRKLFLLLMLSASICMSAQTLQGDINQDGKLTIEDVTKVIELYLNYEEPSDPQPGTHEYVDLGLSVKWATCNIGANAPEEYGLYFAWGETTGYTQDTNDGRSFDWASYKWFNGSYDTITKYCTRSSYGTVDNKKVLYPEDDAAHVNWGGSWRMPTLEEQKELINNCTWTWTIQNGVKGYKVVGKNGNSIFLPAAGDRWSSELLSAGSVGYYWSSSLVPYDDNYAYNLNFNSGNWSWDYNHRYYGLSVRAVCP